MRTYLDRLGSSRGAGRARGARGAAWVMAAGLLAWAPRAGATTPCDQLCESPALLLPADGGRAPTNARVLVDSDYPVLEDMYGNAVEAELVEAEGGRVWITPDEELQPGVEYRLRQRYAPGVAGSFTVNDARDDQAPAITALDASGIMGCGDFEELWIGFTLADEPRDVVVSYVHEDGERVLMSARDGNAVGCVWGASGADHLGQVTIYDAAGNASEPQLVAVAVTTFGGCDIVGGSRGRGALGQSWPIVLFSILALWSRGRRRADREGAKPEPR